VGALVFQDRGGVKGEDRTFRSAIDLARTTHADPRCLASCAVVSGLVSSIMRNEHAHLLDPRTSAADTDTWIKALIERSISFLNTRFPLCSLSSAHSSELYSHAFANTLDDLHLDDSASIGYTYKALGAGVWSLREALKMVRERIAAPQIFEYVITKITMAAGDADTNAAVAGPIVGALLGYRGLPTHWKEGLAHCEWLVEKSDAAAYLLGVYDAEEGNAGFVYEQVKDDDTLVDGGKHIGSDQVQKMFRENEERVARALQMK